MTLTVYSTKRCPHCKALKEALEFCGLEFTERDMSDADVLAELYANDIFARAAPVLQHDDTFYMYDDIFDKAGRPKSSLILGLCKNA